MTKASKPVVRETAVQYRGRPLVVELHAGYIVIEQGGDEQFSYEDARNQVRREKENKKKGSAKL